MECYKKLLWWSRVCSVTGHKHKPTQAYQHSLPIPGAPHQMPRIAATVAEREVVTWLSTGPASRGRVIGGGWEDLSGGYRPV
ncbi:hypothetical protein ACOMHN_005511 [Nucella lapillus]